jgi:hypothetical protein
MNLKTELKNLGYYLITPLPQKYHFEGVNNRRSAIQLTVLSALAPVAIFGGAALAPVIKDRIEALKIWNDTRKMLNKYKNF